MKTDAALRIQCPDGSVFCGDAITLNNNIIYVGKVTWTASDREFIGEVFENGEPKDGKMLLHGRLIFNGKFGRDRFVDMDEGTVYFENGNTFSGFVKLGVPYDGVYTYAARKVRVVEGLKQTNSILPE